MDGVDLYLELKRSYLTASLPVIIVTDKQVFQESFSALGVNHFVPKASNVNVLLAKIREVGLLNPETRQYHKMLICGGNTKVLGEMQLILQEKECLVTVVDNPIEVVSTALAMMPHALFIDLMIEGDILPGEIVHSLRSYARLKHAIILSFVNLPPDTFEGVQNMREVLEGHISHCQSAGANGYLGQFNARSFYEGLSVYGAI
jgi:DNA-binding response OmpR family regulator